MKIIIIWKINKNENLNIKNVFNPWKKDSFVVSCRLVHIVVFKDLLSIVIELSVT